MQTIKFRLKGTAPLLMNNPAKMQNNGAKEGAIRGKPTYNADDEAKAAAYTFADGSLCFPSVGVRAGLLKASKGVTVTMNDSTRRTALAPQMSGTLLILEEFFPVTNEAGEARQEYEKDQRRVMVQRAGIIRTRAKVQDWYLDCLFQYVPVVPVPVIADILRSAGEMVGLGDYRPEKMGWFGRFELDSDIEVEGE